MQKNDVQLIYVKTYKEFRGLGLATDMLQFSMNYLDSIHFQNDMWYVTDEGNLASQKLATKNGFELYSQGQKKNLFLTETLIFKK